MIVRGICVRDFGGLSEALVAIPERGLVTITGPNGAGKSSIFDALSTAVWGRTLRGTTLWGPSSALTVKVATGPDAHLSSIVRGSRSGKPTLPQWEGQERWDTITAANAGLAAMYGPWEVWRRVCYVDSYGTSAFSRATPSERLAMLEGMVGLDALSGAATTARAALSEEQRRLQEAEGRVAAARAEIASLERARDASASSEGSEAVDHAALAERLSRARAERASLAKWVEELRGRHAAIDRERVAAAERVRTAERDLERVEALHWCPTCEREVPPDHAAALARTYTERARSEAARAKVVAEEAATAARRVGEASASERRVAGQVEDIRREVDRAEAEEAARRRVAAIVASIDRDLARARADLADAEQAVEVHRGWVAHVEEAVAVLGPAGVRAAIVAEAVEHLDVSVGVWLDRLGLRGDYRVRVAGTRPRKAGGATQAIDLRVEGHGSVTDIAGLSGGERRRVDLALTAALAELAEAACGWKGATMLYDEPFDALDDAGREAAARMLTALAETRAVLLVTHNEDLLRLLRPDVDVRVVRGVAREIDRAPPAGA